MTALLLLVVALSDQPVASVRLEAGERDQARLRRYVDEIEVGRPLSALKLRHVVELLHATGEFEDVVVETAPGAQGLEVLVRPIPAPLLSAIRIEGPRFLDEKRLKTVTQLRDREPLWPERLERAGRDVALSLVGRGYLEARVQAAAVRHQGGADAVFQVTPGPLARVRQAPLSGLPHGLKSALEPLVAPRPGAPFARARADASAERLRKRLVSVGYWRAAVSLEVAYDPSRAQVGLLFVVDAGPPLEVAFAGEKLPRRLRAEVVKLIRDGGARGDALDAADERMETALKARGHRTARVTHREDSGPTRLRIVYEVAPGPAARVAAVRVVDAPPGVPAPATRPLAALREDGLAEDARRLVRDLENQGYADAKVDVEVAEGGGDLPVLFRVRAGARTEVAEVSVDSPVPLPAGAAAREPRTRAGRAYRARDVALDRDGLVASLRDAGYPQVEVVPEIVMNADRSQATVRLRVLPGNRIEIDHVVLAGLNRTREAVLRRELQLAEGEPLSLSRLLDSQRRLGSLGLFQKIAITEMDPEAEGKRSLVVAVEESPLTNWGWGLGYAEQDMLRFSVDLTRRNLFGMDRSLSTFARVSFKSSRLLATFREPYLLGHKQELSFSTFREEAERPYFSFVRYGATVQTARNLAPSLKLIARYTFQLTDTFNIKNPSQVGRDFASSTTAGPSTALVHDTRDDPLEPKRGHFVSADLQFSSVSLGGDSFLKGFFQGAAYARLHSHLVLALATRVGMGRTFGRFEPLFLPDADRFYLGGDYSLRGFKLDQVRPAGGNSLLFAGTELRWDLGKYLSTAAFAESGNVYSLVSDTTLNDLRYTAGVGVRYRSPLGPLRLDWAYKLNRRPNEDPSTFHFAIGHAF
ncbi:MAG TPA: BamA/TamA family outer membrane protein [Vicinamibacteria bacterium]|nr:BamA/TamA family outer membrane protein [Vicinamibacteria bacterium]